MCDTLGVLHDSYRSLAKTATGAPTKRRLRALPRGVYDGGEVACTYRRIPQRRKR
jgi:hypothetical protein